MRITACLAMVVLASAGIYAGRALRVEDLEEQLVSDANSIIGAHRARQLHVASPKPGTLGGALERHLPALEEAWRALSEDAEAREALEAVLEGARPPEEAPVVCLNALDQLQGHLDGVLAASHSEYADLASVIDGFDPAPSTSWAGYQYACALAGIRARREIAEGRTAEAIEDCLDALALARDAALAGGLVGRMVSVSIVAKLTTTCAAAIESLPQAARPEAIDRLRTIRDAFPRFEGTMREEKAQMQLYIYGPQLGEGFRQRLLARPRMMAKGFGNEAEKTWLDRMRERMMWRDIVARYDELILASALSGAERDAAFEAIDAKAESSVARGKLPKARDFIGFARRADAGQRRLDLIVSAGAAASYLTIHSSWPRTLDELANDGLLSAEEQHRLASSRFVLEEDGLVLEMSLPCLSDGLPKEARIRLGSR